jgi:hypothetical protein
MKRILLFAVAMLLVLAIASPAKAACTDITIGADIMVLGQYTNDYDYNADYSDGVSVWTEYIQIHLLNKYSDNVDTNIRIDAYTHDATKPSLEVYYAYITMKEFLHPNVTVMVGVLDHSWQFRPSWGAKTFTALAPGKVEGAFVFEAQPLGYAVQYMIDEDMTICFAFGKVKEGSVAGNNANDIDVYTLRFDMKLGESNKLFGAFIYYDDQTDMLVGDLWYFNGGIDYFIMDEALELYIEFAYNGGDAVNSAMDLGAFAFDLGAEYTFKDVETVPYVGIEITYIQGRDGSTYGFIRYNTNWTRTLIAESDFYPGVFTNDITMSAAGNYRSGYYSIKLQAGMKSIADDKFAVDFVLAFLQNDGDLASSTMDDGLGWEIDVVAAYFYSEDVTFTLGIGYFNANEDLAGADPDGVMIIVWGVNIVF